MVLLPDTSQADCAAVVTRLQRAIDAFAPVKSSLEWATWTAKVTADALIVEADEAMYEEKRRRKHHGVLRLAI